VPRCYNLEGLAVSVKIVRFNRNGRRIDPLEIVEHNYSGCGEDMANCPKCGHGFAISYRIDKITRAKDWDIDPNEDN